MEDKVNQILSSYNLNVRNLISQNESNEVYKIIDDKENQYLLKIYGKNNAYDIMPNEIIYHTLEQIQVESDILNLLANSRLGTAIPIKNKTNEFVTVLKNEAAYATLTSFISSELTEQSTTQLNPEIAYSVGVSTALLHLESEKNLLPLAVKRPHKRQEYIEKIRTRLAYGVEICSLTTKQFEMLSQCCDIVINCMNQLDEDLNDNVGLVHTDIRPGNFIYTAEKTVLIDFSRSVYSYYLYDLGEMCLHDGFGGSSIELQNAILRGYHSIKPLKEKHFFMIQAFFIMFIMMLMAESIESLQDTWLGNVLTWLENEIHPGLMSGKGYLDGLVFENI